MCGSTGRCWACEQTLRWMKRGPLVWSANWCALKTLMPCGLGSVFEKANCLGYILNIYSTSKHIHLYFNLVFLWGRINSFFFVVGMLDCFGLDLFTIVIYLLGFAFKREKYSVLSFFWMHIHIFTTVLQTYARLVGKKESKGFKIFVYSAMRWLFLTEWIFVLKRGKKK